MSSYATSSKLLIDEYPLMVSPSLAAAIGLNEAILIQQIHFWLDNPKSGIEHDGRRWVWNSYSEWLSQFPFWSESTIKRVIKSARKSEILLTKKLRSAAGDHTNHYAIDYDKINDRLSPCFNSLGQNDTTPNGLGQNDLIDKVKMTRPGLGQNDPIDKVKMTQSNKEQRTPTEISTENSPPKSPQEGEGTPVPAGCDAQQEKTNEPTAQEGEVLDFSSLEFPKQLSEVDRFGIVAKLKSAGITGDDAQTLMDALSWKYTQMDVKQPVAVFVGLVLREWVAGDERRLVVQSDAANWVALQAKKAGGEGTGVPAGVSKAELNELYGDLKLDETLLAMFDPGKKDQATLAAYEKRCDRWFELTGKVWGEKQGVAA